MPPLAASRSVDWYSSLALLARLWFALIYGFRAAYLADGMDFLPGIIGISIEVAWAIVATEAFLALSLLTGLWCRPAIAIEIVVEVLLVWFQARHDDIGVWLAKLIHSSELFYDLILYAVLFVIFIFGPGRFALRARHILRLQTKSTP
jgi:uncharacterized membrane protein YphA (DoxX/SURF4 family)